MKTYSLFTKLTFQRLSGKKLKTGRTVDGRILKLSLIYNWGVVDWLSSALSFDGFVVVLFDKHQATSIASSIRYVCWPRIKQSHWKAV